MNLKAVPLRSVTLPQLPEEAGRGGAHRARSRIRVRSGCTQGERESFKIKSAGNAAAIHTL